MISLCKHFPVLPDIIAVPALKWEGGRVIFTTRREKETAFPEPSETKHQIKFILNKRYLNTHGISFILEIHGITL